MDGEAKAQRGHTHTQLDLNLGGPAPQSVLLTPKGDLVPALKVDYKVKTQSKGTEKK